MEKMFDHDATYSPEDNKLRIYPAYRLDRDDYFRLKKAGYKWAPKQELFVAPMWTPAREDIAIEFCGEIGDEDTSLVDRAEIRADRFEDYSEKRAADAHSAKTAVDSIAGNIPLGQPILIGHHSEKRARKDAERIENGMKKAVKMWETSKYWKMRAAGALRHAKYKERPDVRARRIKKIEADRRRVVNSYTPKNPKEIINQEPWSCPVCGEIFCKEHPEAKEKIPHVYCGASRGGSWVPVRNLPKIKAASKRWLAHYDNRLAYEKAMLGEQGALDLIKKKPRPKQLPLLNYRAPDGIRIENQYHKGEFSTYTQTEMTKAEYKAHYNKYIRPVDGTHRVRFVIFGGMINPKRRVVFLVDSKEHKRPAPAEAPKPKAPRLRSVQHTPPERTEFDDMKDSLRDGVKTVSAPQLFPTPPEIAEQVIDAANIEPGHDVLEPSAGTGALLKDLPCIRPNGTLTVVEINQALADALRETADNTFCADFLSCNGNLEKYDRIIMNPPFENGADIKHIKHAATFLKPGGRLVALCANGPRQQKQLKSIAEDSGGYWEELPQGSFKQAGTMVNAALLVIEG